MLKKYILLVSALLALSVYGQKKEFKPEWNVGVGFGPTFSSVDFAVLPSKGRGVSTKNQMQYHGGIAVRYISENHLGFIAELNYSQQGWEQSFKDNPTYEHSHKLNYLELPFMAHIYFGSDKVRFIFNVGPKVGYLLGENEDISQALADDLASGNFSGDNTTYQYYRNADRKIDYSIVAGMGLELRTGIGSFMLEGRYTFGLGDIYNSKRSDVFSRSANRVIAAKLTYYVKLF